MCWGCTGCSCACVCSGTAQHSMVPPPQQAWGPVHPTEVMQRKTALSEVPKAPGGCAQSITPTVPKVGKVLPQVLLVALEMVHGPGGPGGGGGHASLQHPLLGFLWAPRKGASSIQGMGGCCRGPSSSGADASSPHRRAFVQRWWKSPVLQGWGNSRSPGRSVAIGMYSDRATAPQGRAWCFCRPARSREISSVLLPTPQGNKERGIPAALKCRIST